MAVGPRPDGQRSLSPARGGGFPPLTPLREADMEPGPSLSSGSSAAQARD